MFSGGIVPAVKVLPKYEIQVLWLTSLAMAIFYVTPDLRRFLFLSEILSARILN